MCPSGFVEIAGLCRQNAAYTFHEVTLTSDFTYHQEFVRTGSHVNFSTSPNGGIYQAENVWNPLTGSPAGYYAVEADGYNVSVKDPAPAGYTDNGSQWVKTTEVKDAMPSGAIDDGTQWVITIPMEARIVPA